VNIKFDNLNYSSLLRYLLMVLLMIAPVHTVTAMPMNTSHCDMAVMSNMSSAVEHQVHQHHADTINESQQTQHACCCCDTSNCIANCGMGMTVSLLIKISSYSPVFVHTEKLIPPSVDILQRALSPPSRPPLTL